MRQPILGELRHHLLLALVRQGCEPQMQLEFYPDLRRLSIKRTSIDNTRVIDRYTKAKVK